MDKDISGLAGIGLKWVLTLSTGGIITIILALIILFQYIGLADVADDHSSFWAFTKGLFLENILGFILLFGTPLFIALYVFVANKYAAQTVLFKILEHTGGAEKLENKVNQLVDKIFGDSSNQNSIVNKAMLKVQLIDANRKDPDTSWGRRKAVNYIFKKVRLDGIDFSDPTTSISTVVSQEVNTFISGLAQPSKMLFWILLISQLVIFFISQTIG